MAESDYLPSNYNTPEYIESIIDPNLPTQISQLQQIWISTLIGMKVLINGKKWTIFVFIAMIPLIISQIIGDPLLGNRNPKEAFIDLFVGFILLLVFAFGALMISLPISSDEISDHMTDLYLIRPIKRQNFWLSRWIVVNIGVYVTNTIIITIYFLYFELLEGENPMSDIATYLEALIVLVFATLIYSGIFLLIGSIGNQGFTLGVILAIAEPFFTGLFFLDDSKYIPRNNILKISDEIFGNKLRVREFAGNFPTSLSLGNAFLYVFGVAFLFFILGTLYYRGREFK